MLDKVDRNSLLATSFPMDNVFIGGRFQPASSGKMLPVVDPSTGKEIGSIARGMKADVDAAVEAARRAFRGAWGKLSATERGRMLTKMSGIVLERADELARLESQDVGKPLRQAKADALALARYLEYYGGAADKLHSEIIPYEAGYTVLMLREPLGVTGHIIPWNYPMQIIGRSVAASLAAGNATVVKPAEEACLSALFVAEIAQQAGLPDGAFNVVPGLGEEAGAALSSHRGINHLSFTGSVSTGIFVQTAAAQNSVPVTLELGGKSPQVVFGDADLDAALPFLVNAGIQNAGQTCSASARILVQRPIYDEVVSRMAQRYRGLKVGPSLEDFDVGPLVSQRQREIVEGYLSPAVVGSLSFAAQSEIIGDAPKAGFYVKPTLIPDVPSDHRLFQEEIFGPVQTVTPFDTEEEAVALANGTDYGLVSGVWSRDGGIQLRMARAIQAGQVFVNNYGAGGGVELPFGGVKRSGHGREKGFEAMYGFTAVKTVAIRHG